MLHLCGPDGLIVDPLIVEGQVDVRGYGGRLDQGTDVQRAGDDVDVLGRDQRRESADAGFEQGSIALKEGQERLGATRPAERPIKRPNLLPGQLTPF